MGISYVKHQDVRWIIGFCHTFAVGKQRHAEGCLSWTGKWIISCLPFLSDKYKRIRGIDVATE